MESDQQIVSDSSWRDHILRLGLEEEFVMLVKLPSGNGAG